MVGLKSGPETLQVQVDVKIGSNNVFLVEITNNNQSDDDFKRNDCMTFFMQNLDMDLRPKLNGIYLFLIKWLSKHLVRNRSILFIFCNKLLNIGPLKNLYFQAFRGTLAFFAI